MSVYRVMDDKAMQHVGVKTKQNKSVHSFIVPKQNLGIRNVCRIRE